MINFLYKLLLKSKNSNYIYRAFNDLGNQFEIKKIFKLINNFSENSEIRYVGGCVRKIIKKEIVDDIDLAVNLRPKEVCQIFDENRINFYKTGIDHGTITVIINKKKFEITSLRKDLKTDGRHAKVEFSDSWYEDASRRDFTINSIYSDINGNLYDPFMGKKDIEDGLLKFIGIDEERIKEDYLRILRYVRFFLNYSKSNHSQKTIRVIKKNIDGISKISSERLIDEFRKIVKSKGFFKLYKDKFSLEIISLIFPQFKNFSILNNIRKDNYHDLDFVILIALLIIDKTDNVHYFFYKFNFSNKDKKRILFINEFFSKPISKKTFSKENLWKILYFEGKQSLLDIINFHIFKSNKKESNLVRMIDFFKDKDAPILPFKAVNLISKYNLSEGKELGEKLKKIEKKWISNNFIISEKEVQKLVMN